MSARDRDVVSLAALPQPLQQALHTAILQLDVVGIERALRAIEQDQPAAAARLRTLADNYQYVQLLRLFERVASQDVR